MAKKLTEGAIRNKYPNAHKASILLPDEHTIRLPSRILSLNWQIGGGIPYGRFMEVFGYESTGKSLLAMDFAYVTQALNGIVLWADLEGSYTNVWAEQNGVDPSKIEIYWGNDIEGVADWAKDMILLYREKLTKNEPILLVVDSIAAGETFEKNEQDMKGAKADMGNRAKAWDKFFRTRNTLFQRAGVTGIFINQIRSKLGANMFSDPDTTPGGKAAGFYASIRLNLIRGKQIKGRIVKGAYQEDDKGHKVGQNVTFQIKKNKTAPPRDSIKTEVYFLPDKWDHVGFNKYLGFIEILMDKGVVKKNGNYYKYKDKTICQGADNFIEKLYENEKLRRVLIKASGINTISLTRDIIDSQGKNLFRVS